MEILDKAKEKLGSDKAVAEFLGVCPSAISQARKRGHGLTDYNLSRLAELTGQRWYEVVLPYKAKIAPNEQEREHWLGKYQALLKTAGVAAGIAAGLILINQDAGVSTMKLPYPSHVYTAKSLIFQNVYYVK